MEGVSERQVRRGERHPRSLHRRAHPQQPPPGQAGRVQARPTTSRQKNTLFLSLPKCRTPTFAICPKFNSKSQRHLEAERLYETLVHSQKTVLAELTAERELCGQERTLAREERGKLSKALVLHRGEVAKHLEVFDFSTQTPISPICRTPLFPTSQILILSFRF